MVAMRRQPKSRETGAASEGRSPGEVPGAGAASEGRASLDGRDEPSGEEPKIWAIVVAAGSGNRFGGAKQFEPLRDGRVIDWSLRAARRACHGVVCVLPPSVDGEPIAPGEPSADRSVPGGATRSASVRAGLAAVPDSADIVVVHDAARPLAPDSLFAAVIEAVVGGADAAIPGVAVHDTIRQMAGGVVDRSQLVAVQTPQAFRADSLRAAHASGGEATDDASLVEAAGGTVVVVPGDSHNLKITDRGDLRIAAVLLDEETP